MFSMSPSKPPAADPIDSPSQLASAVEAVLLTSSRPLAPAAIASAVSPVARDITPVQIEEAIQALNASLDATGRAARAERVAGGFRLMTRPEHAPVLAAVRQQHIHAKLSRAAVETLAIIAYKQPITRADLESIRGVACGEVLRSLMDRRLVTIDGRAEEPGRPMLYGTTREFLDQFGLASTKDLPPADAGAPS
jgi:segregation and condensation protein B